MKQRDKAILNDLKRFRVLERDDIIALHFNGLKNPVTGCNTVMKRLRRDEKVKAITDRNQFLYVHAETNIKPDSSKLPHFLKIVDFYKQICQYEAPKIFTVEPKYGEKGTVEPDIFMLWKGAAFFVEIQRSIYSSKVFDAKMERYEKFYHEEEWKNKPWQMKDKKIFPYVWIITDKKYKVGERPFKVMQSQSVAEIMKPK